MGAAGAAIKITLVDPIVLGDDGGWALNLTGLFPLNHEYHVEIYRGDDPDFKPQRCYSGIVGKEDRCQATNVTHLTCYIPPLPIADNYDIHVYTTDGSMEDYAVDMFDVIHRSFVTNLYTLRSHWPPPRDVGPYSIDEEN